MRVRGPAAGLILALLAAGPGASYTIPGVPAPTCVPIPGFPCPGDDDGADSGYSGPSGGSQHYTPPPPRPKPQPDPAAVARAQRLHRAHVNNEAGVAAYKRQNFAEAVRLFAAALKSSPNNKVIRQNLANAKAALAVQQRKASEEAKRRKREAEYRARMAKLAGLMPKIATLPPAGAPLPPRLVAAPPDGMSAADWRALQAASETVDRLYAKRVGGQGLTDAESTEFLDALRVRNALLAARIRAEPQPPVLRDKLALTLPVAADPALRAAAGKGCNADGSGACAPPPAGPAPDDPAQKVFTGLLADSTTSRIDGFITDSAAAAVGVAHGAGAERDFGSMMVIAKTVLHVREGGGAALGGDAVNFGLGKMPQPLSLRAQMAKEGGGIYANVAFRTLAKVITETSAATGKLIDGEEWLRNFLAEMPGGTKAVADWTNGQ